MAHGKTVVIKKYGNRRLYDTERSEYINLEEVATILKKGRDIQVQDAKSGEDLTRTILLQLILERERNNISGFPVELLKELIAIQDTPARRWFDLSMRYSLELMRRMKRQSGLFRRPMEAAGMNPAGFFELLMGMGAPAGTGPSTSSQMAPFGEDFKEDLVEEDTPDHATQDEDPADVGAELAALQTRLAELEKQLGGGTKKKATRKTTRKTTRKKTT